MRLRSLIPALVLCGGVLLTAPAARAVVITLTPSATTVTVGELFTVGVDISGLGDGVAPSLGTYDLTLGYAAGAMTALDATFGNQLDADPLALFPAVQIPLLGVPGVANAAGNSFGSELGLNAFQLSAFRLVTFEFRADAAAAPNTPIVDVVCQPLR